MFERYTEKARRIIFFARYYTSQFGSPYIETEHLLLGIMHEDAGAVTRVAEELTIDSARKEFETRTPVRERLSTSVDLPLSAESKRALEFAAEEAGGLQHRYIDTCHLILGLLRLESCVAAVFLRDHGFDYAGYRELVRTSPPAMVPSQAEPEPEEEPALPAASALASPVAALRRLVTLSGEPLLGFTEYHAGKRLKRKSMSRKEALGHLVNLAIAHHLWLARALTEPKVVAGIYPLEEWVGAQQYEKYRWTELVRLWISLNQLLVHVLSAVPEVKVNTPCRAGVEEPQTLLALINRYTAESEDVMGQILARL